MGGARGSARECMGVGLIDELSRVGSSIVAEKPLSKTKTSEIPGKRT